MRTRGNARKKAGIIAGLERKIHNLEVKCGSLAAENRKLKKELENNVVNLSHTVSNPLSI